MGPSESVQTIIAQHFQHIGNLFNFLGKPLLYLSVPQNVWHTQITVISTPKVNQKNVQILKNSFFTESSLHIFIYMQSYTTSAIIYSN